MPPEERKFVTDQDSHGSGILDGLPPTTKMLRYQGRKELQDAVAHEIDLLDKEGNGNRSQYMVFLHIDEEIFLSDICTAPEDNPIFRYLRDFSAEKEALLVKMTKSLAHEMLFLGLYDAIRDDLTTMGAGHEVFGTGSSTVQLQSKRRKQPDCGIRPRSSVGKPDAWPTLTMEAGYSQSRAKVDADARAWLIESDGGVKICLAVTVNRQTKDISIKKWHAEKLSTRNTPNGTKAHLAQEVKISANSDPSAAHVANTSLIIDFERLLAREPNTDERDPIIGQDLLGELALLVWESM